MGEDNINTPGMLGEEFLLDPHDNVLEEHIRMADIYEQADNNKTQASWDGTEASWLGITDSAVNVEIKGAQDISLNSRRLSRQGAMPRKYQQKRMQEELDGHQYKHCVECYRVNVTLSNRGSNFGQLWWKTRMIVIYG